MLKKLPKNKDDIKFINPETMEVECTYNQCFHKFIEAEEYVIKTPSWNEYRPIKHKNFFHKCTECDRSYANSDDKGKNWRNYESTITTEPPELTTKEIKQILRTLKKIFESTNDATKKKQVATVFNEYKRKL